MFASGHRLLTFAFCFFTSVFAFCVNYRFAFVFKQHRLPTLTSSVLFKFRQLPDVSEDIEKKWLQFRSAIISSAAESCGQKRFRVASDNEKRTPWWNQDVKEAIRAKKNAFQALLQNRSSSDLQCQHTDAQKAATSAVKKSKEKSWEVFDRWLDSNYFSAKYFSRPSAVYVAKDRVSRAPSRILQITFQRMRVKSFHGGENFLKIF